MSGSSPAVQMSTMPVLESQLGHSQGISMSASPVVAQHGTHINPLVSITSDLGSNVPLTTHEKIGIHWPNKVVAFRSCSWNSAASCKLLEDNQIKIRQIKI